MVRSDLCRRAALSLLELHAGNVDEALSLGLILDDELGERVAAVADGREALRDQVLLGEIRRLHDGGELRVELPDDLRRRSLRREHAEPGLERRLVGGQSGLGERGYVRNQRVAPRSRHQQALDLALVDLARDVGIADDKIKELEAARLE